MARTHFDNINVTRMLMMTKKEFYTHHSPKSFQLATKFAGPKILDIAKEQINILEEWYEDYRYEHV